jgi:membrane-anchored protein YejM (alkaline phosphatase superfamily)
MTSAAENNRSERSRLFRWVGWFGLYNAGLAGLVGLRYLYAFGIPDGWLATLYVIFAFVGQFAVLAVVPLTILVGLLVAALPRRGAVISCGVILAALGLSALVLDTNVFEQYRFHLGGMTVVLFDTSTWVLTGVIFIAVIGFQAMLAGTVWKQVSARPERGGRRIAFALVLVWLAGQGIHIWADANAYIQVTSFNRYLPAYFPIKAKRTLRDLGLVDPAEVERQRLLRRASAPDRGILNYPLNPLTCDKASAADHNILLIVVDALRPDKVVSELTPNLVALAANGSEFTNHYSGGNSSRMGFFSLFYGIPVTYWQAFYDTQQQPVLMEQVLANNYEVAAFSAVGFGSPSQIDRTVFAATDAASRVTPERGNTDDNNQAVTGAWQNWLRNRPDPKQAFFSFIYYDPGVARVEEENVDRAEGRDAKYLAYERGVRSIDSEIGQLLGTLAESGERDNTLIVVVSDHGYEFDDLGLGYVGHASNYGPYQLKSVMIMDWPGRAPRKYTHRSAHQDFPPTLLQEFFACSNPAGDYGSGSNLFSEQSWDWIMAGSYNSRAIIEPDKIVVTNPGGFMEVLGPDYRPNPELSLDAGRIEEAVVEMRRFYR